MLKFNKSNVIICTYLIYFVISLTNGYTVLPNPYTGKFVQQILMTNDQQTANFDNPTNFAFLPDGRILITEKYGKVKIFTTSGTLDPRPWLDITDKVSNSGDRGLLGIAIHPNFATNKYVYLLYSERQVEGGPIESGEQPVQGKLVRYTEVNGYASVASEKIFIGDQWGSGFPDCFDSHHVGTIAFGNDGSLLVSSGEGSHWDRVDWGQDTTNYDTMCATTFGTAQDVGAYRAQMLDSLGGKVIRLDPETGEGIGPTDLQGRVPNPYYDSSAPSSPRSLVWAYGLRNPFKFSVRRDTNLNNGHPGTLYIGDVGWDLWEEVHVAADGGTNLGWPCYQGPILETRYSGNSTDGVGAQFCDSKVDQFSAEGKKPTMFWHHTSTNAAGYDVGFIGNCAAGVALYRGQTYPDQFVGDENRRTVFFADYGATWIKVFWVDQNDQIVGSAVQEFAESLGNLVAINPHPDTGELYYLSIFPPALGKFIYSEDGEEVSHIPPTCTAGADVVAGRAPLTVQFSSDNSYDLQNSEIKFEWDFGDGTTSTSANPQHTFSETNQFNVTLKVTNVNMMSSTCSIMIRTDKSPPVANIVSPAAWYQFSPGETVTFTASATDPDSDELSYQWEVVLVHNNHKHFDIYKANGTTFSAQLSSFLSPAERNCLEVNLTVIDEVGLTDQKIIRVLPQGFNNTAPEIKMKMTPQSGRSPLTITFIDDSVDNEQDWLDCTWDFGDNTKGTGLQIRHTYQTPGEYLMVHNCVDAYGASGAPNSFPLSVSQGKASLMITPKGGVFANDVTATMESIVDGITIHYTLDGTEPTASSQTYTGPITLSQTTYPNGVTLKAIGFAAGRDNSDIYTEQYKFTTLPSQGQVTHLSFNKMSPLSIQDCSNNFMVINSTSVMSSDSGKYGKAADFMSTDSSIQLQMGPVVASQMTLTFWIQPAGMSQVATLVTVGNVQLQYFPSNSQLVLANTNTGDSCVGTAMLTPNTWHSIGVTVDATTCAFLVDGQVTTEDDKFTTPMSASTSSLAIIIGSPSAGIMGFTGMIDELFVYNQTLDKDTTSLLLTNPTFPNSAPQVQFTSLIIPAIAGNEFQMVARVVDDCEPANSTITTTWTQLSGPAQLTLEEPPSKSPFVRQANSTEVGTYTFQIQVSDGMASSSATVTVNIAPAYTPSGPEVNPCGGFFPHQNGSVQVTIDDESGSQIYVSTDGTNPATVYASPITITTTTTLRALTLFSNGTRSQETTCIYEFSDISSSLILHYNMESLSSGNLVTGDTVPDTSKAKRDGVVSGNITAVELSDDENSQLGAYAAGMTPEDQINTEIPASLNMTVACWIRLADSDVDEATLFSFNKTSTRDLNGWSVVMYSDCLALVGTAYEVAAFEYYPDTNWTHVAVSVTNAQDVVIFVNGEALGSSITLEHPVSGSGVGNFTIGGFRGSIDEVSVLQGSSTNQKIAYLMNAGDSRSGSRSSSTRVTSSIGLIFLVQLIVFNFL